MEAEQQLDIFAWVDHGKAQPEKPVKPKIQPVKAQPKKPTKPKPVPAKAPTRPKKFSLKLKIGEIAYQCLECDPKPTVYDRIKPKATCQKCGVLLEVIDERIPKFEMEEKKSWL